MRISIVFFSQDTEYTDRLAKRFQDQYMKNTSVKTFSDEKAFANELSSRHVDIVVIEQEAVHLRNMVPESTVLAVLVDHNSIDEIDGIPAVGKYQKFEYIYKRVLGIYADNSVGVKIRRKGEKTNIIMFTSAQGGCGVSSLAAAYALNQALLGNKVFYLNLETFGTANSFFCSEGQGSFSDVIYALKSSKTNTALKLQTVIKQDESGVEFFDGCKNAFDMLELKDSEIPELIEGITLAQNYDRIVIDYSRTLSSRHLYLLKDLADTIIYVNDGSIIGNDKFTRFCEALCVIEQRQHAELLKKMHLVYNRFSSKTSRQLETIPVSYIGGIHRIEGISGRGMIEELAKNEVVLSI